jgi:hypothetical protein
MFEHRVVRPTFLAALIAAATVTSPGSVLADGPSAPTYGNFPLAIVKDLEQLAPKGISAFAVAPNGGYAIVSNDGRFSASNTPQLFTDKLQDALIQGLKVQSIAFGPNGAWVFATDQGAFWDGIPQGCADALNALGQKKQKTLCVTLGLGEAWIVITDQETLTGNLPPDFVNSLNDFASKGGIKLAALSTAGGSSVFANGTRCIVQKVPDECLRTVEQLQRDNRSIDEVAFSKNGGWIIISSAAN